MTRERPGRAGPRGPDSPRAHPARASGVGDRRASGARRSAAGPRRREPAPSCVGSTGTSSPASSMIASVKPCQVVAPAFVKCRVPVDSRSTAATIAAARSAVKVGVSRWSATTLSEPCSAGTIEHPRDEVAALRRAAVQPVETGSADDERIPRVGERRMFAGELGDGVDAARIRASVLVVWLGRVAVEHVVGADVHEAGARLGAALGEPLDRARVHGEGAVLLALAHLDVVEGGAVDDERRAERLERRERPPRRR